jgi:hypothetical protein
MMELGWVSHLESMLFITGLHNDCFLIKCHIVSFQMEMLLSHFFLKLNFEYRYCDLALQVRDYIHVMDLASGHTKALDKLFTTPDVGKYDLSFIQAGEADSRFTRVGENVCSPCFHTVSELGACWAFRFLATTTSITVVHMPASKARIFLISCWFIL